MVQAYCFKCRVMRDIRNPRPYIMKNKRPSTTGVCHVCGTKVFRIGKS